MVCDLYLIREDAILELSENNYVIIFPVQVYETLDSICGPWDSGYEHAHRYEGSGVGFTLCAAPSLPWILHTAHQVAFPRRQASDLVLPVQ